MRSLFGILVFVVGACAPEEKMGARTNGGQPDESSLERSPGVVVVAPRSTDTTASRLLEAGPRQLAPSAATTPATRRAFTVVFVGTSLTAGYGLPSELAYPSRVAALAEREGVRMRAVNAGVSGETSAGALRRMDWIVRNPADVFVIETGANDGLRGLDVDSTRENLVRIIDRTRTAQPRARILLLQMEAPPNYGVAYVRRFRGMYGDVARQTGAMLAPFLLQDVAGVASLNQADGMHPNREGAERVAANVWRSLKRVLEELSNRA